MPSTVKKLDLSFPQRLIQEPILHNIAVNHGVMFNIHKANVTEETGFLEVSLEGDDKALEDALEYLRGLGVTIKDAA